MVPPLGARRRRKEQVRRACGSLAVASWPRRWYCGHRLGQIDRGIITSSMGTLRLAHDFLLKAYKARPQPELS